MKRRVLAAGVLLAMLLAMTACGTPAAIPEELFPEPTETPELLPEAAAEAPDDLPDVDITSWEFLLANSYNSIAWYLPEYGPIEGQGLDPRVVPHAEALLEAARAEGLTAYMAAALRNTDWCFNHFLWERNDHGKDTIATVQDFLPLGANEHQTGLAIDFTDNRANRTNYDVFEDPEIFDSELYAWLVEHCAEYGFILRYPEGKEHWYGTPCHHAHFRYVGVEAAQYIMEHDLCLEEFLMLYDPDAVYIPEHGAWT